MIEPRRFLRSMVLAVLFFGGFDLLAAEAVAAEQFETVQFETEQAETEQFEAEYRLTPDDPGSTPDWHTLLHQGITDSKGRLIRYDHPAHLGVILTGPVEFREGEHEPIAPASTSKLFTAGLALSFLKSDYVFETKLEWNDRGTGVASDLHLFGSGDPTRTLLLGSDGLWHVQGPTTTADQLAKDLADQLSLAGIKTVVGPIQWDATDDRWKISVTPKGWDPKDQGVNVIGPLGSISQTTFNRAMSKAFTRAAIAWSIKPSSSLRLRPSRRFEIVHRSAPLRELISTMLLYSVNTMAEGLLRKVGEVYGSRANANLHDAGLELLREYVSPRVGGDTVTLYDGCGLSRKSRVTADAMIHFLESLRGEKNYFRDLFTGLPIWGSTGTLRRRKPLPGLDRMLQAKTGTLHGHYQLAGYLVDSDPSGLDPDDPNRYHPFVFLTDTGDLRPGYWHAVQDQFLTQYATVP